MKILIRNSDNVVIYAEQNLVLTAEGTSGDGWFSPQFTTANSTIGDAELPPRWTGAIWAYINGVWAIADPVAYNAALNAEITALKIAKNNQINTWRAEANQTYFTHQGKRIACDQLSRSDIDAVAANISLTGAFPAGFPGAWKAIDNTYIMLPNIAAFKLMYESMTLQGTTNFGQSQSLKATLAAATTVEQINAIIWIS